MGGIDIDRLLFLGKPEGGFRVEAIIEGGPRYVRISGVVKDRVIQFHQVVIADRGGDVTVPKFRKVNLGEIRQAILFALHKRYGQNPALADFRLSGIRDGSIPPDRLYPGAAEEIATLARESAGALEGTGRRRGRPPLSDAHLEGVARTYLRLVPEGRDVIVRMAEEYGEPASKVRYWVHRARREGWLSGGIRGKPGAEPGSKLKAQSPQGEESSL